MSLNILAMLISLAMMLTGVGGEGQPADGARSLVLHDVCITYNDENLTLNPALRLGVATDGEKAVYDLGVDLNGETLFPMQLGVAEDGLTLLFEKSDVALNVSADALNALGEQATQMMQNVTPADGQNAELMTFITEEFVPAYTGLLSVVKDEELQKEIEAKGKEVFAGIVDRGEGTPVTEEIDGVEYALIAYSYTMDSDQMAAMADGLFTCHEALENYYNALFKLYDMLPEESGLNGIHSYKDLFDKTHIAMSMEIDEKCSDDGAVDIMAAKLTIDMAGMAEAMGGEDAGIEIPPIVMDIESSQVGEAKDASVRCDYEIEESGTGLYLSASASSDGPDNAFMDMEMNIYEEGERAGGLTMSFINRGSDETGRTANMRYQIDAEGTTVQMDISGQTNPDGTGTANFDLNVDSNGMNAGIRFAVDAVNDAIEDKANGHEAAVVLDDLSEEKLNALGEDQAIQGALMQVVGTMMTDAQTLTADESVQALVEMFMPIGPAEVEEVEETEAVEEAADEGVDYVDDSFEEEVEEYSYDEVEDDGELGYEVPEFTWLPEGWEVAETDIDTAYDWVSITLAENGEYRAYATFFEGEDESINYVVGGDGEIEAVDGREITLTSYDDTVSVSLNEEGLYGNLVFMEGDIDVETIGSIVAGIQFK